MRGKVLKVIFENCLLTDEEKIKACELSVKGGELIMSRLQQDSLQEAQQ